MSSRGLVMSAGRGLLFLIVAGAAAQDRLCEIVTSASTEPLHTGGTFGLRANSPADVVIRDILRYSGLYVGNAGPPDFIVVDTAFVKNNALAVVCSDNQRYIFYDPDFVANLGSVRGKDWPKYFVFAHEIGHHLRNHPLGGRGDRRRHELDADGFAAFTLARMGATLEDILAGVDSVAGEADTLTHPGRCRRRAAATDAYNIAAEQLNRPVVPVPACNGRVVLRGFYLTDAARRGTPVTKSMVRLMGTEVGGLDRPQNFASDVSGLCLEEDLGAQALLTWQNLGLCGSGR